MVVGAGKGKDTMELVAMEELDMVDEYVMAIRIAPTTSEILLTSKIFLGISAVTIGMPVRGRSSIC